MEKKSTISINSELPSGPSGGGISFVRQISSYLEKRGWTVIYNLDHPSIDVILHVNTVVMSLSKYSHIDAYKYKIGHPKTKILQRVNECDARKGTDYMNGLLREVYEYSDGVVYISNWLKNHLNFDQGKPNFIVENGADSDVFYPKKSEAIDSGDQLKIVTHHWGGQWNKGHSLYQELDRLLEHDEDIAKKFSFTYIGQVPEAAKYKRTKIISPKGLAEISDILRNHHIYITGSLHEPAGMHHIEGGMSGLPIMYMKSGAIPEYCEPYGIETSESSLKKDLLQLADNYEQYQAKMSSYKWNSTRMLEGYFKVVSSVSSLKGLDTVPYDKRRILATIPYYSVLNRRYWRFRLLRWQLKQANGNRWIFSLSKSLLLKIGSRLKARIVNPST